MSARFGLKRFLVGGLLVALLLAGVVSAFASSSPDGLDSVTRKGCTFSADGSITSGSCIAGQVRAHGMESSPFAGYATRGVDGAASTGLSGVAGVLVTLALAWGLTVGLRRTRRRADDEQVPQDASTDGVPPSPDAAPSADGTPSADGARHPAHADGR